MSSNAAGRVRVERSPKRVRVQLGGEIIADTTDARLVWEGAAYPMYYIPAEDVRKDLLSDTGEVHHSPSRGDAHVLTVTVGGQEADGVALWYPESPLEGIDGTIRFDWGAMDAWFEEDEEVYVHPRDPYRRVDILQSSRHVRVEVNGITVADSRKPRILFETGLPPRYYLPKTDVRMDLLSPTSSTTQCPYKGTAQYYSVEANGQTHDDLVWWYQHPTLESAKIAGYVCFYNEHVDLYIDGVLQERPRTPFSRRAPRASG